MPSDTSEPKKHQQFLINLEEIGVNAENIGFANVSMTSENFICIRENKQSSKAFLRIIDFRNGIEISEKPMSADSSIMNPKRPHLALKAQDTIQVFDIDSKDKICSIQITFEVIFWRWLDENTLLLVSDDCVFQWKYNESDSIPTQWFDKSSSLNDSQIINAGIDKSGKWCYISGISLKNGKIVGSIQLYNQNKKLSQVIDGHSGNFFSLQAIEETAEFEYSLFAFCSRTSVTDLKLHLIQIDGDESVPRFPKRVIDLPSFNLSENDFPINVVFEKTLSLVFVYTKFGYSYVVEPHSGTCLLHFKYSDSPIYLVIPSYDQRSTFILTRNGDVMKSVTNIEELFSKLLENGPEMYQPIGIVMNNVYSDEQKRLYRDQFDNMKNSGNYLNALLLVAKSGKKFMRTFEYLSSIKDFPNIGDTSALLEYFALILESGSLNEVESLELVQLAISKNKLEIVRKWLATDKIFCTSQLGKVVLEVDQSLALEIFEKSGSNSMILHCLATMGNFDEFSTRLEQSSADLDAKIVFSALIKSDKRYIPSFIKSILIIDSSLFNEQLLREILNADLDNLLQEVIELLLENPIIFNGCNSIDFNTDLAIKILEKCPALFPKYMKICQQNNMELRHDDILLLLKEVNMPSIAISYESDFDEALKLSASVIGTEDEIYSMRLSSLDIKNLILKLLEDDSKKFGLLCAKFGQFIEVKDFEEVKNILKKKLNDSIIFDFLIFWSNRLEVSDKLANEILNSAISLKDDTKLSEVCQRIDFPNPLEIFKKIKTIDYKSNSLKIYARKNDMHVEIMKVFESNNDREEASKYFELVGQDIFWGNLCLFLSSGVSDDFIKPLIPFPENTHVLISIAQELEKIDHLDILSAIVTSPNIDLSDLEILVIKLKLWSLSDENLFSKHIANPLMSPYFEQIMEYTERKNPKLALDTYLHTKNADGILNLSFRLESWDKLALYLIESKQASTWSTALDRDKSKKLFSKVVDLASIFPDSESASCLIKVLSGSQQKEMLLEIISALLEKNDFLRASRSLQTLYIIGLVEADPEDSYKVIENLNNYDYEQVLAVASKTKNYQLSLNVLVKFELWNYAFKVSLYGLKDINFAKIYAQKSGHSEAWHALAEFCILVDDPIAAVEFAKKSGNFRRQKELVILLHSSGKYDELLDYLLFLKKLPNFEPIFEREIFFCLVKLGKMDDLESFISCASSNFANELGKILYRDGLIEMAAKCFIQSGNFDRAATCYLQLDNIDNAADSASKTSNFSIWLDIIKMALNNRKFDIARKFGLKCTQKSERIQELFNVFDECEAYDSLIEIIELVLESSAPQPSLVSYIGEIYCKKFPEKLENFITKHYSSISSEFDLVLADNRRWKESFKLNLLRSNLDNAIELVICHPSIQFDHKKLTAVIGKIRNQKVIEKLLEFYFVYDPRTLLELQDEFSDRLEIGQFINFFRERDILFVLDKALRRYQTQNPGNISVAMGLNEILIQSDDYYGLIDSMKKCASVDSGKLAEVLKVSSHKHFRILAAKLMANSGDFSQSLSILVQQDALIEILMILSQSSNIQYAEAVLTRYSKMRNAVMFLAVAYVLYDLLRPDVIFELSNRSQFQELSLPLYCQIMRHKLK